MLSHAFANEGVKLDIIPVQAKRTCSAVAVEDRIFVVVFEGFSVLVVRAREVVFGEKGVALALESLRLGGHVDR